MATFIEITEPDDVRLRDYVSLRDTSLRHSIEAAEGLFIDDRLENVIAGAAAQKLHLLANA